MKKKISILMVLLFLIILSTISYGKTNNYLVTDKYEFNVESNLPSNAYIKIFLGNINVATYQAGSINISPKPTSYEFDEYGNRIAVYNMGGYGNSFFTVNIKKNVNVTDYTLPAINNNLQYNVEKIYLESSNHIESTNQLIIAKANQLTNGKSTDYEKAKAIFEFVNMYMTYDTSDQYRNKGAVSALNTKRGVCEDYAALFVALCRASNIPARIITGFRAENINLNETADSTNIYHAWTEVYLKGYGWLSVEVTAEKRVNNVKTIYYEGFLNLQTPTYIVEGIYNNEISEIRWAGVSLKGYNKTIKYVSATYFSDINNHWAKNNIEKMYDEEIIKGYEDDTFKPDNNITRIEFIVMLNRLLKKSGTKYLLIDNIYYPKDFVNNWSKEEYDQLMKYYAYASNDTENGAGYNTITYVFGDRLSMNSAITREEVIALMAPFFNSRNSSINVFTDINQSKFKSEIEKLTNLHILNGYEDGTFRPKGKITRAEVATIFARAK